MAAVPHEWQPLGELLIDRGYLTEKQLTTALADQEQSGRRLGEILVASGAISGPVLANAIATQHGQVVKTEFGFGTGLPFRHDGSADSFAARPLLPPLAVVPDDGSELAPVLAATRVAIPELRAAPAEPVVETAPLTAPEPLPADEPEAEAAPLDTQELLPADEPEAEVVPLEAPEPVPADEPEPLAWPEELPVEPPAAAEAAPEPPGALDDGDQITGLLVVLEQRTIALASLESTLAEREHEVAALRSEIDAGHADRIELERLRAAVADLESRVEAQDAPREDADEAVRLRAALTELEERSRTEGEETARLRATVAELETTLETRASDLRALQSQSTTRETRIKELAAELDATSAERDELRARPEASPATRPVDSAAHVLFVPRSTGYGLVERDGAAPEAGTTVELDGDPRRLVVARVGRSPLPGDRRAWAFVELSA